MASSSNNNNIGDPVLLLEKDHGPDNPDSSFSYESSAMVESGSRALSKLNHSGVVQVHQNKFPVQFNTIRLNTDLNRLPRDWSKTKFQGCGWNSSAENVFSPYPSVNLAHSYKDLVGKVDVISSSKNIKNLLKMPYQQSPQISLMVHRLGKTLLLEEFDVHNNLIKKDAEEWQWLHDFYRRYVNNKGGKNSSLVPLHSPITDPLSEEMYRNLIRHSISVAGNACRFMESTQEMPRNVHHMEGETQDLKGFRHESLWQFHDRSMLVDSDLPIFGTDSKRPCISLRLRDSRDASPINVLTGLDYWLDNLMSNVPEVAMVYHLDGFVQKYEVLRTEDIPNLENSKFDPDEVMELARNVMAFIKNRAVVEGHTYWLYKGENDDTVKLYDLTEYCKKELRKDDNPFTVPVGLLCYHVGRNLKVSGQRRSADCRAMLENCIRLLIEEDHPQICADAHYLLSDMWVPDRSLHDIWHGEGKIADPPDDLYDERDVECDSNTEEQDDDLSRTENESLVPEKKTSPKRSPHKKEVKLNEVALRELVVRGMIKRKAWDVIKVCRIAGETDERCMTALDHIRKGLRCIDNDMYRIHKSKRSQAFHTHSPERSRGANSDFLYTKYFSSNPDVERDQLRFAKPFVPIPLHYSPLKATTPTESSVDPASDNCTPSASPPTQESSSQESSSKESASQESSSKESASQESTSKESSGTSENSSSQSENSSSDSSFDPFQWYHAKKLELLRKAAVTFYILADQFHGVHKRGHTLRYVRYGLHCYECLFAQSLKSEADVLEEEVYFHLVYLAAKARCCLDYKVWASCKKDFEELGEVETAILNSAQSILQSPKEPWVYKWPENEEKNLKTAKELFKKLLKMKMLEKKPLELRLTVKRQMGICTLNIGHVLVTKLKTLIARGASADSCMPLSERIKCAYDEACVNLMEMNERLNAGFSAMCLARMYQYLADILATQKTDKTNPISKQENELLLKMFEAVEKALSMYGSDEKYDDAKEDVHDFKRHQYYKMAAKYFTVCNLKNDAEKYKTTKDLLYKALSCCFLDPQSRYVKNSYSVAAIVYYNLAMFHRSEMTKYPLNSDRYNGVRRKMMEDAQKSFDIYCTLKWARSMIAIRSNVLKIYEQEYDAKYPASGGTETDSHKSKKRRMLTNMLSYVCELTPAVELMTLGSAASDDGSQELKTCLEASKKVLDFLSKIFMRWLKVEKCAAIKDFYKDTLSLTRNDNFEELAKLLHQLLIAIKKYID